MGAYPLPKAATEADIEAVKTLLKTDAPLNELDDLGHTALHWAVFEGYEDIVQALLEAGADANAFSRDGLTPKWGARDFGLTETAQLLTKFGGRIGTNENCLPGCVGCCAT